MVALIYKKKQPSFLLTKFSKSPKYRWENVFWYDEVTHFLFNLEYIPNHVSTYRWQLDNYNIVQLYLKGETNIW